MYSCSKCQILTWDSDSVKVGRSIISFNFIYTFFFLRNLLFLMLLVLLISWIYNLKRASHLLPLEDRLGLLICFQIIEYEKEKSKFAMEKTGKRCFFQVINVNINSDVMLIACIPWCDENGTLTQIFFRQTQTPHLIMRNYHTNLNWGTFYKISDEYFSKM